MVIYKLTSPSLKVYIGQTKNLEKRLKYYKFQHCKSQKKLYNAIAKYGFENFTIEILYEDLSVEDCNLKETETIIKYNSHTDGYNCNTGGFTNAYSKRKVSKPFSEERKKQLSEKLKGSNNPFYGNSMFTGGANPSAIKVYDTRIKHLFSCKKEMYEYYKPTEKYRTFVKKLQVLYKEGLVEFIYPEHYKKYYENNKVFSNTHNSQSSNLELAETTTLLP